MKRILLETWTLDPDEAFEAFYEHAPIFMISADATWRLQRISAYFAEALGREPEAIIGEKVQDLLTPESREKASLELLPQFTETRQIASTELDFLRADGSILPVVLSARARIDETGQVVRVLAILYDNGEARQTRAALERAIAETQEASRAKSRFLAAMGHEIRTPMNAILGFAQLLKMSDLDERRTAHVDAIQSAGGTLMNLLTDLLDLSQAEAGQMRIDAEPFDLEAFLTQLAEWWQTAASEKGLRMRIAKDQGLPRQIVSDRNRIQQVLNNYLGNAVKFTDSGRITLAVEEVSGTGDKRRIRFEVSDTGRGLSPDQADQLFKPFVQFNTDFSKERGGWGLGLSICHEIAEAMGGCVGVCSQPDEGATFFFEIDVGIASGPVNDRPDLTKTSDRIARAEPKHAAGLDILVAEDNAMSRAMMREMLTELGHRVTVTDDGLSAIDALQASKYDLVFMDVMMPNLDGISAVRRIRKEAPPLGGVPIVGCSAHTDDADRYRKAGMDDFIPKPVDRRRLERVIAKLGSPAVADAEERRA